ncbi:MAG: response regulator transcription factor, partial [Candidatus Acidiferrum sp.]
MRNTNSIRIVIADDHTVLREGVRTILGRNPEMSVIAEARDWPEAIRAVLNHHAEIALLDVRMPGMEAHEGVSILRQKCPNVGIIMFSAFDRDEEIYGVIRAGARGFLLKDCPREELRECIFAVHQGKTWLTAGPAAKLASRVQASELTNRQREILELVAEGKTNKEVGNVLNITEGTVKVHVNHI